MEEYFLLRCPFCGGHPEMRSEKFLGKTYWQVKCPYCFAGTYSEPTPEEAAEQWNQRA